MIYMPLEGVSACFRRHNGTHQFGCSCKKLNLPALLIILIITYHIDFYSCKANAFYIYLQCFVCFQLVDQAV